MTPIPGSGISITLVGLHQSLGPDPRHAVEVARIADAAGIDHLGVTDHVVMGERTDRYPYGPFPFPPADPWPEPLILLAAMASATCRVRLGTGILIAPLRPAVLLAKSVATLDALSGGRVDLGVGIGWQEEEYAASGVPFARRWSRLDDTLRACRVLWRDVPATFQSETVSFERTYCTPLPTQARLPIWFGAAATEAVARRIAELGDGWMPLGALPPEQVRAGMDVIRAACAAIGRDPAGIGVRCGLKLARNADGSVDWPRILAPVPALRAEGVTMFSIIAGPGWRSMDDARAYIEALGREFAHIRGDTP